MSATRVTRTVNAPRASPAWALAGVQRARLALSLGKLAARVEASGPDPSAAGRGR